MDIKDQWNAIATPLATGIVNGLPALEDKYCVWGDDGKIHVYKMSKLKPWEAPVDITESVPVNKRLKIKAPALGQIDTLPQADQDAIAAAEQAEKEAQDPIRDLKDVLWELCSYIAAYQYPSPPAYLADWKAYVDAKFPDGPTFFRKDL